MRHEPSPRARRRAVRHAVMLAIMILGIAYLSGGYMVSQQLTAPTRHAPALAALPGVDAESVETVAFSTADGLELVAWWLPSEQARGTAVLVHGYGGSRGREYVTAAVPIYRQAGWQVLAVDLRAHGESEGERSSGGGAEVQDLAAALAWLGEAQSVPTTEVVLHGWSMGGSTAIPVALGRQVAGLVTEGAFASLEETLRHLLPAQGVPQFLIPSATFMARHAFAVEVTAVRPVDALLDAQGDLPYLLMHGSEDQVVPVSQARQLLAAYPEADGWILEGYGHMALHTHPQYGQRLEAFLEGLFTGDRGGGSP